MAKRTQLYRVAAATMASLIGRAGELIVNTTRNSVHVHDSVTPNGFEMARADLANVAAATASNNGYMTAAQAAAVAAAPAAPTIMALTAVTRNTVYPIPTGTGKLTLYLDYVRHPADAFLLQFSANGVPQTSNYRYARELSSGSIINDTSGFKLTDISEIAYYVDGAITLTRLRTDSGTDYRWVIESSSLMLTTNPTSGGEKNLVLSGTLRGITVPYLDGFRFNAGVGTMSGNVSARFET